MSTGSAESAATPANGEREQVASGEVVIDYDAVETGKTKVLLEQQQQQQQQPQQQQPSPSKQQQQGKSSGMNLKASKPVTIECQHVNYTIKTKQILFDINSKFEPGELCALMGGSGAGKTTLLNVISGMAAGKMTGEVLVNKKPLSPFRMKKVSNLVPQLDVMIPVLTAKETLLFAAALRVPGTTKEREEIVDQLLRSLSLEQCADVVCGNEILKGLSGGQRKRVSVGLELMTNPAVLFLDEPTSGLDSKVAEDVVKLLQEIAASGRTVLCTIHQPNFQVFNMFTKLLMLNKGRVVYDYKVSELTKYLAEGLLLPVPGFTNPADFFMSVLAGDIASPAVATKLTKGLSMADLTQEAMDNAEAFANAFTDYQSKNGLIDKQVIEVARRASLTRKSMTQKNVDAWDGEPGELEVSSLRKFAVLANRVFVTVRRDKRQMRARIFQQIFLGLIIGSVYYQMPNTQDRIQDRQSVLFMVLLSTGMSTIMQTVTQMPVEKAVLLREYRNGYYGTNSYFLSRMVIVLSLQLCYSLLHSAIVYPLAGFHKTVDSFFIFYAILGLTGLIGAALGFMIGAVVPTIEAAIAIVPMVIMPLNLFSGLLVQPANIPNYWIWVYYISFFQYPYQNFLINEFEDLTFQVCDFRLGEYCPLGPCPNTTAGASALLATVPGNCSGTLFLDKNNYKTTDLPMNFGIMVGFLFAFLVLGWLAIRRLVKAKQ